MAEYMLFWDMKSNTPAYTGPIPSELGAYTELTTLKLGANSFTYTVPSELGLLLKMEYIGLDANELTGTLPTQLGGVRAISPLSVALTITNANYHQRQPFSLKWWSACR